jgi:D-beta-D-heptose 7-phosphate kinase/D-beta-D-heptose 1-phosphate adenosyltransferase
MQQEYAGGRTRSEHGLFNCSISKILLHFPMENVQKILARLHKSPIAVFGDFYLDEYIHGEIEKIADDGPVPIVQSNRRSWQPAAAAYVSMLLANLGAAVYAFGRVGRDLHGQALLRELEQRGINCDGLYHDADYVTPSRLRISVQGPHYPEREVMRVSSGGSHPASMPTLSHLTQQASLLLKSCQALVVIDKESGLVGPDTIRMMRELAAQAICIGDSERHVPLFKNFDAVIVNEAEAALALQDAGYAPDSGDRLRGTLQCRLLYVSHGAAGMSVHQEAQPAQFAATEVMQVYDVVGAGEAVVAAVTAGMVANASPLDVAGLANLTAGVAVAKPGLAEISREELLAFALRKSAELEAQKVVSLADLKQIVIAAHKQGKKVVWTNGCFDIMHVGHILYLEKARRLGDLLIVGLNSDASVRSGKGPSRPIVEEKQRAKLMSALSCVDYITVFDEQSPVGIIELLQPDVYAKGGDYSLASLNQDERRIVEAYGGRIELLPGVPGMSTSHLIDKILKTYQ